MALEQSINLDSKTKGGIISITQRPSVLQKWFLTAHERKATTTATKSMPTSDGLPLHIQCANYQAMIWKPCLEAFQQLPQPVGNGWEKGNDGYLKPLLMTRDAAPKGLAEFTVCKP